MRSCLVSPWLLRKHLPQVYNAIHYGLPNHIKHDAMILMDDNISHTRNLFPRHAWKFRTRGIADILTGLADHDSFIQHCTHGDVACLEHFKIHLCDEPRDPVTAFAYVLNSCRVITRHIEHPEEWIHGNHLGYRFQSPHQQQGQEFLEVDRGLRPNPVDLDLGQASLRHPHQNQYERHHELVIQKYRVEVLPFAAMWALLWQ